MKLREAGSPQQAPPSDEATIHTEVATNDKHIGGKRLAIIVIVAVRLLFMGSS